MELSAPQATVALWRSWLTVVEHDVLMLHAERRYWRDVVEIVKANPSIPSPVHVMNWITRMYVSHVSSGIRRQLDRRRDVVSMRRLLGAIYRNPTLLTRADFVKASCAADPGDEVEVHSANATFDRLYAVPGTDHVDRGLVKHDMDLLATTGAKVEAYVNERVAHLDEAHADPLAKLTAPTFNDLHEAVDLLGSLLKKYFRLLKGASLTSAEPIPPPNWTMPFTVAWQPNEIE